MSIQSLETIYNYLRLSERIGTSGQPLPEEFAAIQEDGFDLVVNLLPDAQELEQEETLVWSLGMEYIQIPVRWDSPEIEDIERFFKVMDDNSTRKVFVHCAANMRVSAFLYLYGVLREGLPAEVAARDMQEIWTPNPIWEDFIHRVIAHYNSAGGEA
jgi:protein tyrosine phosphatase (PTP) superfamily phosphohydrolase (DUF442 family)